MVPPVILNEVSRFTGPIAEATAMGGGCIHSAHKIRSTTDLFFLKWNKADQAHNFEVEAKGLGLLAANGSLRTPRVIAHGEADEYAFLLLEYIDHGHPAKDYWIKLGEGLAHQHRHTRPAFGLDYDNYIGSLPQYNRDHATWAEFFVEERLKPQYNLPRARRLLGGKLSDQLGKLFTRLTDFFPEEPPALLHGDLWGGNLLTDNHGQPVLVDPAVFYGHREAELAYMGLFDNHPQDFFDAYQATYPLEEGWRERRDLYNLYPLLVHVNLFGATYVPQVASVLESY